METRGVVISTLRDNSTDIVVAALPIEILPISPRASISTSDKAAELAEAALLEGAAGDSLRNRASISSCDRKLSLMSIFLLWHYLSYLHCNTVVGAARLAFELLMLADNDRQFLVNFGIKPNHISHCQV